jgi:hypothetical protein
MMLIYMGVTQIHTEIRRSSNRRYLGETQEKTKYMLTSQCQNAGQYHNMETANRLFENVAKFI